MAFHLGCLRALNELSLLDKVDTLSTISGGSVIGAYYAYTPDRSFSEFEEEIRSILREGFQRKMVWELLKPQNLFPCLGSFAMAKLGDILGRLFGWGWSVPRFMTRTDVLVKVFSQRMFGGLTMPSPRRNGMKIVMGACELRTGAAFRFAPGVSGDWRHGALADNEAVPVALAAAASAAYPLFLPCLDRKWRFQKNGDEREQRVTLTDGGVYDNLGIQVLEPGRDPAVSLHAYPCDYLIVCNAGPGQDSGDALPTGFYRRMTRAFEVIHRRVQDSAMNRLHHLASSKQIKGFAMPYLGQIDARLPSVPEEFVERAAVVDYPTNFAAMSDEWIDRLSTRGEQLTRVLVAHYLPELVA